MEDCPELVNSDQSETCSEDETCNTKDDVDFKRTHVANKWMHVGDKEKHERIIKIYTLGPFIFGRIMQPKQYVDYARKVDLFSDTSNAGFLDNRALKIVDLMEEIHDQICGLMKEVEVLLSALCLIEKINQPNEKLVYPLDKALNEIQSAKGLGLRLGLNKLIQEKTNNHSISKNLVCVAVLFACREYVSYTQKYYRNEDLVVEFESKCERDERDIEDLRQRGNERFRTEHFEEAGKMYTQALERCPFSYKLYGNRAQTFINCNSFTEAIGDGKRSIILKQDWAKGHYRYTYACLKSGLVERATTGINIGIRICPSDENIKELYHEVVKANEPPELVSDSDGSSSSDEEADKENGHSVIQQDKNVQCKKTPTSKTNNKPKQNNNNDTSHSLNNGLRSSENTIKTEPEKKNITDEKTLKKRKETQDREKLESTLTLASKALFNKWNEQASLKYKEALHCLKLVSLSYYAKEEIDVVLIKYCLGYSYIDTKTMKGITTGIENHETLIQEHRSMDFPLVYYNLGSAYILLNRYRDALKPLEKGLQLSNKKYRTDLKWPGTTTIIIETKPGAIKKLFESSIQECYSPPAPDAVCRYFSCPGLQPNEHHISVNIYISHPEFKGFTTLRCFSKCQIDYHADCWKKLKRPDSSHRISDREILKGVCLTPDCNARVESIVHTDEKGLIKENSELRNSAKDIDRTKVKSPAVKLIPSSMRTIEKRRDKKLLRKQRKAEAKERREEKLKEAERKDSQCSINEENKENDNNLAHNCNNAATIAPRNEPPPVSANINQFATLLKRDESSDDEMYKVPKNQGKKKKKDKIKGKNTMSLGDFVGPQDEEDEYLPPGPGIRIDGPMGMDSFEEIRYPKVDPRKPFAVPPGLQPQLDAFHASTSAMNNITPQKSGLAPSIADVVAKSPTSATKQQQTKTDIRDGLLSFFAVFLEEKGPLHIEDKSIYEELENFPREAKEVIREAGGIGSFLRQSLNFAMLGEFVCLMKDAAKAKELSEKHIRSTAKAKLRPLDKSNFPTLDSTQYPPIQSANTNTYRNLDTSQFPTMAEAMMPRQKSVDDRRSVEDRSSSGRRSPTGSFESENTNSSVPEVPVETAIPKPVKKIKSKKKKSPFVKDVASSPPTKPTPVKTTHVPQRSTTEINLASHHALLQEALKKSQNSSAAMPPSSIGKISSAPNIPTFEAPSPGTSGVDVKELFRRQVFEAAGVLDDSKRNTPSPSNSEHKQDSRTLSLSQSLSSSRNSLMSNDDVPLVIKEITNDEQNSEQQSVSDLDSVFSETSDTTKTANVDPSIDKIKSERLKELAAMVDLKKTEQATLRSIDSTNIPNNTFPSVHDTMPTFEKSDQVLPKSTLFPQAPSYTLPETKLATIWGPQSGTSGSTWGSDALGLRVPSVENTEEPNLLHASDLLMDSRAADKDTSAIETEEFVRTPGTGKFGPIGRPDKSPIPPAPTSSYSPSPIELPVTSATDSPFGSTGKSSPATVPPPGFASPSFPTNPLNQSFGVTSPIVSNRPLYPSRSIWNNTPTDFGGSADSSRNSPVSVTNIESELAKKEDEFAKSMSESVYNDLKNRPTFQDNPHLLEDIKKDIGDIESGKSSSVPRVLDNVKTTGGLDSIIKRHIKKETKSTNTDPYEPLKVELEQAVQQCVALQSKLDSQMDKYSQLQKSSSVQIQKMKGEISSYAKETKSMKVEHDKIRTQYEADSKKWAMEKRNLAEENKMLKQQISTLKFLQETKASSASRKDEEMKLNVARVQRTLDEVLVERQSQAEKEEQLQQEYVTEKSRAEKAELDLMQFKLSIMAQNLDRTYSQADMMTNQISKKIVSMRNSGNTVPQTMLDFHRNWAEYRDKIQQVKSQATMQFEEQIRQLKQGKALSSLPSLHLPAPPTPPSQGHMPMPGMGMNMPPGFMNPNGPRGDSTKPPPVGMPPGLPSRPPGFRRPPLLSQATNGPSSSKHHSKTSFSKIMDSLCRMFPNYSETDITNFITEVRRSRDNKLTGLTLDEIVHRVTEVILHDQQKKGPTRRGTNLPTMQLPSQAPSTTTTSGEQEIFEEEENPCLICHDELSAMPTTLLECEHCYHTECIKKWFKEQSTCPTCRVHALLPDEFPALS